MLEKTNSSLRARKVSRDVRGSARNLRAGAVTGYEAKTLPAVREALELKPGSKRRTIVVVSKVLEVRRSTFPRRPRNCRHCIE